MLIGTLGLSVFWTSESMIRTFKNFERSGSVRWVQHDLKGQKPVLEYIGSDLDTVKFDMYFNLDLGLPPALEITAMRQYMKLARPLPLLIGFNYMGFFVIENIEEKLHNITGWGMIIDATITITLKEYRTLRKVSLKEMLKNATGL